MICFCIAAQALWSLGYPAQALKRSYEAISLAQQLSHPHSLAFALGHAARIHQFCQDEQAAYERAEETTTLSTEHRLSFWVAWGTAVRGWALVKQGQKEEGITQIQQGLAAHVATGAKLWRPYYLALLAEAYANTGQIEEGRTVLAEALKTGNKIGERYYEAELHRLRGELTLVPSSVPGLEANVQKEAEECFSTAIDWARQQQAKSWELRAATSLARLWQQQAQDHAPRDTQHDSRTKLNEAHRMLSEVYNWFTEGFDTKDLQEAKALLESLTSSDLPSEFS
jgi:predicted ATPase